MERSQTFEFVGMRDSIRHTPFPVRFARIGNTSCRFEPVAVIDGGSALA
jgi:hypothetical protein